MAERQMKKRERGANYTEEEKALLADLVMQYKDIIEDKNTSAVISNKKKQAWKAVTAKYNSHCTSGPRDTEQLKTKYDNMKQIARKSVGENNITKNKSACGPPPPTKSEIDAKILSIIHDQVEPLHNPYDSGARYYKEDISIEDDNSRQASVVASLNENNHMDDDDDEEDFAIENPLITEPKIEVVESPVPDQSSLPVNNYYQKNKKYIKNRKGVPLISKKIKKNASAETLKRIYFRRKCENANLEHKKLIMEIIHTKREHTLKMKILKKQLEKFD